MESIRFPATFAGWKDAARAALARGVTPAEAVWLEADDPQPDLALGNTSAAGPSLAATSDARARVPREFLQLAGEAALHRETTRWALLYRLLWRLTQGEPHLLEVTTDPDVIALGELAKAVRRDLHKMRAFVRFREVSTETGTWFVAWFEPHHHIVRANAAFFVDRFAVMNWSILTPDECVHWDQHALRFTPGVTREQAPSDDVTEELWRTYYANIFNPARVKVAAMTKEMPAYYWSNLPEADLIPGLLAGAEARTATMVAASRRKAPPPDEYAPAPVPESGDWEATREAARRCRACPLWRNATCTVFGEGPDHAPIVVVGEQPGDQEDLAGRPFVGPAGKLFDRALEAAHVNRDELYVTNAVKHFKWKPQGKRRLHQKPNAREIAACRPWLEAELRLLRPRLIVCLGGTAAQSVLGHAVGVLGSRGQKLDTPFGIPALITVHPSSLLRQPDPTRKEADFAAFVDDLRQIRPTG